MATGMSMSHVGHRSGNRTDAPAFRDKLAGIIGRLKMDNLEDVIDPQEETFRACRRIVETGIWLIKNGYGKLGLLPYAGPTGFWRCEYQVLGRPDKVIFRYTSGDGTRYLENHCGGSVRKDIAPSKLGPAILKSVPDSLKSACAGDPDAETIRWLELLERELDAGFIPEAFHEYTEDYSRWMLFRIDGHPNSSMPPQPGYVVPGEERGPLSEPFWTEAAKRWNAISDGHRAVLDLTSLTDDEICFEVARKTRDAMADVPEFEAMRVLRCAVADLHRASGSTRGAAPEVLSVSRHPPESSTVRRAARVLAMVHELHKTGRQKLRVCAGWSHDGSEWRLHIASADNILPNGWTPADFSKCVEYRSGSTAILGWEDSAGKDARWLAERFIERHPEVSTAAVGRDWAYLGWHTETLGHAEHGNLPAFYQGVSLKPRPGTIFPPSAGGAWPEVTSGTGHPLIPNAALRLSDLPPRGSGYEELWPFCLSYDGYAGGLRTIDDCLAIARAAERKGLSECTMDELRITAFIRQREAKNHDIYPPPSDLVMRISSAVDEIRRRLEGK